MKKIVKISRKQIIDMFSDTEHMDVKTMASILEDYLRNSWQQYTNDELLQELEDRGDLEPDEYNPFGIREDYDEIIVE
jgi:hypothetical protein